MDCGDWCHVPCEIRPDFVDHAVENEPESPTKGTQALAHGYKLLIINDLFGGEGGIRTTAGC